MQGAHKNNAVIWCTTKRLKEFKLRRPYWLTRHSTTRIRCLTFNYINIFSPFDGKNVPTVCAEDHQSASLVSVLLLLNITCLPEMWFLNRETWTGFEILRHVIPIDRCVTFRRCSLGRNCKFFSKTVLVVVFLWTQTHTHKYVRRFGLFSLHNDARTCNLRKISSISILLLCSATNCRNPGEIAEITMCFWLTRI